MSVNVADRSEKLYTKELTGHAESSHLWRPRALSPDGLSLPSTAVADKEGLHLRMLDRWKRGLDS